GSWADDGETGSAYVYERNRGGQDHWGFVTKVLADDPTVGSEFGYTTSLQGDLLVVGAPLDNDKGKDSGSVYVFHRNFCGPEQWGEVLKITARDGASNDTFGIIVAASGTTIVSGALTDDDPEESTGSASVYELNFPPAIICPENILINTDSGQCSKSNV